MQWQKIAGACGRTGSTSGERLDPPGGLALWCRAVVALWAAGCATTGTTAGGNGTPPSAPEPQPPVLTRLFGADGALDVRALCQLQAECTPDSAESCEAFLKDNPPRPAEVAEIRRCASSAATCEGMAKCLVGRVPVARPREVTPPPKLPAAVTCEVAYHNMMVLMLRSELMDDKAKEELITSLQDPKSQAQFRDDCAKRPALAQCLAWAKSETALAECMVASIQQEPAN